MLLLLEFYYDIWSMPVERSVKPFGVCLPRFTAYPYAQMHVSGLWVSTPISFASLHEIYGNLFAFITFAFSWLHRCPTSGPGLIRLHSDCFDFVLEFFPSPSSSFVFRFCPSPSFLRYVYAFGRCRWSISVRFDCSWGKEWMWYVKFLLPNFHTFWCTNSS